jgi:hypothetical protein
MAETLIKVRFELDDSDWHGHATETLWAAPVANANWRHFELRNSPFFSRGINHLDIVSAKPTESDRIFDFVNVIARSGHSTYMLLMEPGDARLASWWDQLQQMGCSYESTHLGTSFGPKELYSVDMPPTADLHEAYEVLTKGEHAGIWMFQEGHANVPGPTPTPAPLQKH